MKLNVCEFNNNFTLNYFSVRRKKQKHNNFEKNAKFFQSSICCLKQFAMLYNCIVNSIRF